jgi:hypothetical protein
MGAPFLRKYATGSGSDIYIPIVKRGVVDFAVSADWTPAAGDVKISIDGGAAANIGTLPTAVTMGNGAYWKFVFSNGELTGKKMVVEVADSATKAVEDQCFLIETHGNALAQYQADLTAAALAASDIRTAIGLASANLDTQLAAIKAETDLIPVLPTGTVVTNAGSNTATSFKTDRTESTNDYWKDAYLILTSGAMSGQVKKVSAYVGSTKVITMSTAFTGIPADGVTFLLVNR